MAILLVAIQDPGRGSHLDRPTVKWTAPSRRDGRRSEVRQDAGKVDEQEDRSLLATTKINTLNPPPPLASSSTASRNNPSELVALLMRSPIVRPCALCVRTAQPDVQYIERAAVGVANDE